MKKLSLLFLLVILVSGCAKGGLFSSSYDTVQLNQPYSSTSIQYTVNADNETGQLVLNMQDITPFYRNIYVNVMVSSNDAEDKIIGRRGVLFDMGEAMTFRLPFTVQSLPITIYYNEMFSQYDDEFYPLDNINVNWAFQVVK